MSSFHKPYTYKKNQTNVELDLSNYTSKDGFKGAAGIDTSKFANEVGLVNLNWDIDKLSRDVVENDAIKKTLYDALVKKLKVIQILDTIDLV